MGNNFNYIDGLLSAGGVSLAGLAEEFGTPLYVYCLDAVRERVAEVRSAFSGHPTEICYSIKANSNVQLLRWFADQGLGFDAVSGGELQRLLRAGISTEHTVFAGVGKSDEELLLAAEQGIWMVIIESVGEARRYREIVGSVGKHSVPIGLRLNLDVDAETHRYITTSRSGNKFGIEIDAFAGLLEWLKDCPELEPVCLHMHLGSQITSTGPYVTGIERLMAAKETAENSGFKIRWLNAGGGFGIPHDESPVPSALDYASSMLPLLESHDTGLILELGRYLVGPSGCLLTRILDRKRRKERILLVADAGMTEFVRPALYEAFHRILPVEDKEDAESVLCDIAGPICESTDMLGWQRRLPDPKAGDLLAVMDTGAYAMSMSSNYNSRLRPAEVLITGRGDYRLIRRRDTPEDLLAAEIDEPLISD